MSGFVVSVTRFRLRSRRFLPFFLIHAQRCLVEIRRSDGYIAGALRRDHAYWTTSVWRDEAALLAYVTGGAHRNAMPRMNDWGDEASTVRWIQESAELPSWPEAIERMRSEGHPVPLRHPGPAHVNLGFATSEPFQSVRIQHVARPTGQNRKGSFTERVSNDGSGRKPRELHVPSLCPIGRI